MYSEHDHLPQSVRDATRNVAIFRDNKCVTRELNGMNYRPLQCAPLTLRNTELLDRVKLKQKPLESAALTLRNVERLDRIEVKQKLPRSVPSIQLNTDVHRLLREQSVSEGQPVAFLVDHRLVRAH